MQLDEFDARSVALIDFLVCHLAEAKQRVVQSFSIHVEQESPTSADRPLLKHRQERSAHDQ